MKNLYWHQFPDFPRKIYQTGGPTKKPLTKAEKEAAAKLTNIKNIKDSLRELCDECGSIFDGLGKKEKIDITAEEAEKALHRGLNDEDIKRLGVTVLDGANIDYKKTYLALRQFEGLWDGEELRLGFQSLFQPAMQPFWDKEPNLKLDSKKLVYLSAMIEGGIVDVTETRTLSINDVIDAFYDENKTETHFKVNGPVFGDKKFESLTDFFRGNSVEQKGMFDRFSESMSSAWTSFKESLGIKDPEAVSTNAEAKEQLIKIGLKESDFKKFDAFNDETDGNKKYLALYDLLSSDQYRNVWHDGRLKKSFLSFFNPGVEKFWGDKTLSSADILKLGNGWVTNVSEDLQTSKDILEVHFFGGTGTNRYESMEDFFNNTEYLTRNLAPEKIVRPVARANELIEKGRDVRDDSSLVRVVMRTLVKSDESMDLGDDDWAKIRGITAADLQNAVNAKSFDGLKTDLDWLIGPQDSIDLRVFLMSRAADEFRNDTEGNFQNLAEFFEYKLGQEVEFQEAVKNLYQGNLETDITSWGSEVPFDELLKRVIRADENLDDDEREFADLVRNQGVQYFLRELNNDPNVKSEIGNWSTGGNSGELTMNCLRAVKNLWEVGKRVEIQESSFDWGDLEVRIIDNKTDAMVNEEGDDFDTFGQLETIIRGHLEFANEDSAEKTIERLGIEMSKIKYLPGKDSEEKLTNLKKYPDLFENDKELKAGFRSLFKLDEKYWQGYQMTGADLQEFADHLDGGVGKNRIDNSESAFHPEDSWNFDDGDRFEVDGFNNTEFKAYFWNSKIQNDLQFKKETNSQGITTGPVENFFIALGNV